MNYRHFIELKIEGQINTWFYPPKREALEIIVKKEWIYGPALHHCGSLYLFATSLEIHSLLRAITSITSTISLRFLSRVSVGLHTQDAFINDAMPENLKTLIPLDARAFYDKLPKQENLFETRTFEDQPDWFKNGTWIIPPSTT